MSNRKNNAVLEIGGIAWNQKYSVADATAALLHCVRVWVGDADECVEAYYDSTTAFSSTAKAACINFPKGSVVYDLQAKIIWVKTAASGTDTWCYGPTYT